MKLFRHRLLSPQAMRNVPAPEFAICWNVEGGESVQESYVNLIPTAQGGTHVNGLRSGVTDAMREFCELRNLLPRNMKLSAEDVWDGVNYILSLKFSGAAILRSD